MKLVNALDVGAFQTQKGRPQSDASPLPWLEPPQSDGDA